MRAPVMRRGNLAGLRGGKGLHRRSRAHALLSKSTQNNGKRWSAADLGLLAKLSCQNMPTRLMGLKLGRTADAVYRNASQRRLSLLPPNQRPHGRRGR